MGRAKAGSNLLPALALISLPWEADEERTQAIKGGNGGHTERDERRTVSETTKNDALIRAPALSPAPAPPELPAPAPAQQGRQELVSSSKSGESEAYASSQFHFGVILPSGGEAGA
jgi:hypothetical protein